HRALGQNREGVARAHPVDSVHVAAWDRWRLRAWEVRRVEHEDAPGAEVVLWHPKLGAPRLEPRQTRAPHPLEQPSQIAPVLGAAVRGLGGRAKRRVEAREGEDAQWRERDLAGGDD